MMKLALIVPVLSNFEGFTRLIASVDLPIYPVVIDNYSGNNVGVGPAWNAGLIHAAQLGIDHAIVVNDDVVFKPGVMRKMVEAIDKGYALVSPQNETGVCHPNGLNFWCFGVNPGEFLRAYGTFDENYAPAYYEDDDMAYRIGLLGGVIRTLDDYIYHEVQKTSNDVITRDIWDKNLALYTRKWGGEPTRERFSHPYNDLSKSPKYWRKDGS